MIGLLGLMLLLAAALGITPDWLPRDSAYLAGVACLCTDTIADRLPRANK